MEFIVDNDLSRFRRKVFLRTQQGGNDVIIGQRDDLLIEQTLNNDDAVSRVVYPLFEMPDRMVDEFIKAVVEYANKKGVRTENENLLQGKLAATEKHLEDMRTNFKSLLDKTIEKL